MSSYASSNTSISDDRQSAQGENISGKGSSQANDGGWAIGDNSSVSITGTGIDVNKTFEQLVSSQQSSLGAALGLTGQLASGIFESNAESQDRIAGIKTGGVSGQSNMMYIVIAIVIMVILIKR